MREIVLDTETTGLDPSDGHRVIEIGCVELVNHVASGRHFHRYLNPERDVPLQSVEIHGLTEAFLADKPTFDAVAGDFLAFVGDDPIVAHNAEFDMRFINAELARSGYDALPATRAVDTVAMARRKFPGAQASLDALCRRFEIDLAERDKHGALLDAQLLAQVYLELIGGRQPGLGLADDGRGNDDAAAPEGAPRRPARPIRPHEPDATELAAHAALLDKLEDPIWRR